MTENSREIGGRATRRNKQATAKAEKMPRKTVPIYYEKGDSEEAVAGKYAALATSPELAAYRVISGAERVSGIGEHLDVPALLEQLREQAADINRGDLAQTEAMLMNQATALQSLFARLAERAMSCDHIPGFEANMRMALRAQNQGRATLETLATIKNPPIVYAKQANISAGHQQVNNGLPSRTRENEIEQNKLSEVSHELLQDTRASGGECGTLPKASTLETFDRPEDSRG
jgi:hypothetical protein